MRVRLWLLIPLTLAFVAASTWASVEHDYLALWRLAFSGSGEVQLFVDLTVAIVLVSTWMVRDARKRGIRVVPFLLVTVAAGSAGPLLYLWRLQLLPVRDESGEAPPTP